jgi:hypothetical protein
MNDTDTAQYPYKGKYQMYLSIGCANAAHQQAVSPAKDSSYSQTEWEALSITDQEAWFDEQIQMWSADLIELTWYQCD